MLGGVKNVTRSVRPGDLPDLLQHPPRATLAHVEDGEIRAEPVAFRFEAGRYLVGLPPDMAPPPGRVKVLIDDGPWYFDLRGLWFRGMLTAVAPFAADDHRATWFEVNVEKVAAWHYGRMREV